MEKLASYRGWEVVSELVDLTGRATLLRDGKFVADSEDVFELIMQCPAEVAAALRKQLVADMIQAGGGVEEYQKAVTNNRIAYGNHFYDFMDDLTIQEFADQGVFLSYSY